MLNNEPAQLNLLKKLQEATTNDVDEERGSFKKGDKVTYDMLGGGLTNSDLIRTLGTNEHATRANHNEAIAEIVEAIGEAVARYSIMFEDGFVINDVAASELKSVNEATKPYTITWQNLDEPHGKFRFLDVNAHSEPHAEAKAIDTLKRDGIPEEFIEIKAVELKEVDESKTNEAEEATDTMKPQEKPDINAKDFHMEDYSEEDLEKVKSKSAETGDAIRQVDDKELKIEPDKTVTPKKESKLKEQKEGQFISIPRGSVFVEPGDKIEALGDTYTVKQIGSKYLIVVDSHDEESTVAISDIDDVIGESKLKEEETEFTPSRAEASKITDEKLRELHKNALRSLKYWEKDGTAPEKVESTRKAVARYEEMMVDRGLKSKDASSEKKESKFSFMKKQDPLWLCNECCRTFRADEAICTLCKSENVEKITEQYGAGFTKEVFQVTWKNTDTGKEESTRVMAFDKADAKKEAKRSNREITKVEGPITKEALDVHKAMRKVVKPKPKLSIHKAMRKFKEKDKEKDKKEEGKVPFDQSSEGSKLHETVRELVGEVSGIDKAEQSILIQAIEKGDIPNVWPSDETMIDKLSADPAVSKIHSPKDIDGLDMGEIRFAYLKYILLPKAKETADVARESKLNEQEVEGVPEKGQTYNIYPTSGVNFPDGNYEVTDVSYRWTFRGDLAKHFQVAGDDRWWIAKFYGFKDAKESEVEEAKEIKPITAIEIVRSKIDPEAYNIRVVELPEGSIVILDSVSDKAEAIKRGKKFARDLNAKFLGIIDEKKVEESMSYKEALKIARSPEEYMDDQLRSAHHVITSVSVTDVNREQIIKAIGNLNLVIDRRKSESKLREQEEDTFQTIAKGITDKADADRLAKEKEGQVIQDEEDKTKFAVLVRIER